MRLMGRKSVGLWIEHWRPFGSNKGSTPVEVEVFSHAGVNGSLATLWGNPNNVLRRILDIAGFTVHTVLSVDLQAIVACFVFDILINTGWAVARLGSCISGQIELYRDATVFEC